LFAGPVGIAIDASGNVYVVDMGNDRVRVFNVELAE
jgi:DNA-binding beta-propeller fold protein YncE